MRNINYLNSKTLQGEGEFDCMRTSTTQYRAACRAGKLHAFLMTPTVTALAVLSGPIR